MSQVLTPDVAVTITFYSDHKGFAFAARNDTGASCYISPMLAEQAGLDRSSAGRQLIATLSPNTDDHGGTPTVTTPWRVLAWGCLHAPPAPAMSRDDLEDVLRHIDQLRSRVEAALSRIA